MTAQCTSLGLKAFNILHNPPQPPPHITHHAIIHSLCIHWILLSMTSEILQKSWNSKNYRNRGNNRTALLNMESESTIYIFQSILIKLNHDPVDYWIHQVSVFSCDAFLFLALFTSRYFFIFLFFLLQISSIYPFHLFRCSKLCNSLKPGYKWWAAGNVLGTGGKVERTGNKLFIISLFLLLTARN